ncbi:MAG TPA: ATP-dependent DNA helicase [Limnobacter sp.]|uniref:ATP-dependent DNA helicase n=1 Tax=Limnobacter sp. TaxID=2003368 RepID=UPI002E3775F8|nr:ATP-dependent DNA helicase [Limnobacter sp.]HEX5485448.1 ATP-dependent DNA helicase [Limnobacter sp.]
MNDLSRQVEQALSPDGLLATAIPGFSPRQAQLEMSRRVAEVIESTQALVVEAGTGTGKTYAYLVPALLSGKRVLVSTATKTLQDQLFAKDIPMVRKALGVPVQVALLKGRQNYICHFHLERALREARLPTPRDVEHLHRVKQFAMGTDRGDKADCSGVPENSPVWSWVTSNKDNCLGGECPNASECFVNKARRDALDAEVVVINHHLFMADLALKEEGVAELLPACDLVVFDEAHQLPEIATHLLGQSISTAQCQEFLRDVLIEGRASSADAGDWDEVIRPLETRLKDIRRLVGVEIDAARLTKTQFAAIPGVLAACEQFELGMEQLIDFLAPLAPRSESWVKLQNRAVELTTRWQAWFFDLLGAQSEKDTQSVRWVNVTAHTVQFCDSPLDVSDAFAKLYAEQPKAWVFTSATLSVKNSLSHFTLSMGLDESVDLLLPSPFDYENQALLCVPENLPFPNESGFSEKLCETIWPVLRASDGGVFFLCTSLRAVRLVGDFLRQRIEEQSLGWQILVQGDASRAELLEQFRAADKPVLVGAASFWEGVDIRGDQLRLVIIDRLPFAPPDDPVFQAKSDWVKSRGGSPFQDLSLPDAAIALKQGAGRLIRDESDRGVLLIGDRRLVEKGYGKMLWRSLPPFKRTRDLAVAVSFLSPSRLATSAS